MNSASVSRIAALLALSAPRSNVGMACCHCRHSRALASVSNGPSVHALTTSPSMVVVEFDVILAILGEDDVNRDLALENYPAGGRHACPQEQLTRCRPPTYAIADSIGP